MSVHDENKFLSLSGHLHEAFSSSACEILMSVLLAQSEVRRVYLMTVFVDKFGMSFRYLYGSSSSGTSDEICMFVVTVLLLIKNEESCIVIIPNGSFIDNLFGVWNGSQLLSMGFTSADAARFGGVVREKCCRCNNQLRHK